jgi:hypothetical protein
MSPIAQTEHCAKGTYNVQRDSLPKAIHGKKACISSKGSPAFVHRHPVLERPSAFVHGNKACISSASHQSPTQKEERDCI